jgi:hypothetical protein
MTTEIAYRTIKNTKANLQLAEDELDKNTLGLEEAQIIEERKTLQWLWVEMLAERRGEGVVHRDEQEQAVDNSSARSG